MPRTPEFQPNWTSAPGDTILDILEERGLSENEFALDIGQTIESARDLLNGRATITIAIARRLSNALGASVEFWMSRDYQYRQDIRRLNKTHEDWLAQLPIGDMIRFGWLTPAPHPSEELDACLRFFGVSSVTDWNKKYSTWRDQAVFRNSPSFDSQPAAVVAWIRQGEIEAERIDCTAWNPDKFRTSLNDIRTLTRERDPQRFLPKLQTICAESGVAMSVVRAPNGCYASGAALFTTKGTALMMLSFRYLTDDHFWFTFFHEAGHLLMHSDRDLFLEISESQKSIEEEEANEFAARTLIPIDYREKLQNTSHEPREVIKFARMVGISPGIVVGQMQHYGYIGYNQLNSLKRRFQWEK